MSTALSTQCAHGYVFAFTGGAQKSVMGQITFFEMDQNHMGSVVNQYRSYQTPAKLPENVAVNLQ
jgi:hypothetical protein